MTTITSTFEIPLRQPTNVLENTVVPNSSLNERQIAKVAAIFETPSALPHVAENLDLKTSQSPQIGRLNLAPISNRDDDSIAPITGAFASVLNQIFTDVGYNRKDDSTALLLNQLPSDVIKLMLFISDLRDISACMQTCHTIYNYADMKFWKELHRRNLPSFSVSQGRDLSPYKAYREHFKIFSSLAKGTYPKDFLFQLDKNVIFLQLIGRKLIAQTSTTVLSWDIEERKCISCHHIRDPNAIMVLGSQHYITYEKHMDCIRLYKVEDAKEEKTIYFHDEKICSIWTSNHKIAIKLHSNKLHILDEKTYELIKTFDTQILESVLKTVVDGKIFSQTRNNPNINIWDLNSSKYVGTLIGHQHRLFSIIAHQETWITGSRDKTIRIWDKKSFDCLNTLNGHIDSVSSLAAFQDVLFSASSNEIKIWDLKKGTSLGSIPSEEHVDSLVFDNGKLLSSSGWKVQMHDFNPPHLEEKEISHTKNDARVRSELLESPCE